VESLLDEVKQLIEAALPGSVARVEDATGMGNHLRAEVEAPQFAGLGRLEQHRLVHAAVRERMEDGSLHALALKTVTRQPEEAETR